MIITNNELLLRVYCEPVLPEEVGSLVEVLENELNNSAKLGRPGIGLAAPQIGIAKNIAIIRMGKSLNFNLVNCKFVSGYNPKVFKDEGCLSFPGRVENTMRFQEVRISSNLVYPNDFVATGLLAVACQHELDHLNQKLFIDHIVETPKPFISGKSQKPNELCNCNSMKKYKKCCGK